MVASARVSIWKSEETASKTTDSIRLGTPSSRAVSMRGQVPYRASPRGTTVCGVPFLSLLETA